MFHNIQLSLQMRNEYTRGAFRSKPSHLSPLARQLCDCEDLARLAVDSVETVVLKYGVNRVNNLKEICICIKFDS